MFSSLPPFLRQLWVSCRPLFCSPQPKTSGQSSQKSLLFLCMTRMTSPPSASRQAATSPLAFLRLPCLTSSNLPPRPPPSWLLRPCYPQIPSSSSRVLTGTMLWPLLLSVPPRWPPSHHPLQTAQPITTTSRRKTPSPNRSWWIQEEEVKGLSGWKSLWTMKSAAVLTFCLIGWRTGPMLQSEAIRRGQCATWEWRSLLRACGWGWSWIHL